MKEWVREETRGWGEGKGKGKRRGGGVRMTERGREGRKKNHISFIKFGFKNHNESPRHVDKNHQAPSRPRSALNDAPGHKTPHISHFLHFFKPIFHFLLMHFYTGLFFLKQKCS